MGDTGCDMTEEELLALLKGISGAKPVSPLVSSKKTSSSPTMKTSNVTEEDYYIAPSAESVLASNEKTTVAEADDEGSGGSGSTPESLVNNFSHKQWKTRQQAYDEAATLFSACSLVQGSTDPTIKELAPLLAGAADDSNASANDSALDMITAWATVAPSSLVASVAESVVRSVAGRGFAARASSQAKAHECVLKLMESDDAIAPAFTALLAGCAHKKPKVPPECLKSLTKAYESFGAAPLPNKVLLATLKQLMEHTKKDMRAAALDLACEFCRWVSRQPLESALADLKSATKKEVDARLDGVETLGSAELLPTVGTRKQRKAAEERAAASSGGAGEGEEEGNGGGGGALVLASARIEASDLVDAVDLPAALGAKGCEFFALVDKATKWNAKKAGLDLCVGLIGDMPKLVGDDYGPLVRDHLLPLALHSHQQVSALAVKVLGLLGQGLRDKFPSLCHGSDVFALLTGRLKEKKLVGLVGECLDKLVASDALSLDKFAADDNTALAALVDAKKSPQPHARVAVLSWLERSVKAKVVPAVSFSSPTSCDASNTSGGGGGGGSAKEEGELGTLIKQQLLKLSSAALEAAEPVVRDAAEALLLAVCAAADKDASSKEHKAFVKALGALLSGGKKTAAAPAVKTGAKTKATVDKALKVLSGEVSLFDTVDKAAVKSSGSSTAHAAANSGGAAEKKKAATKDKSSSAKAPPMPAQSASSSESSGDNGDASSVHHHCASITLSAEECMAALGASLYGRGLVGGGDDDGQGGGGEGDFAASVTVDEWEKAVMPGLDSDKWQDKVFAFGLVGARCGLVAALGCPASEAVVVVAETKTKGWSENNSVIIKGAFEMVTACAEACAARDTASSSPNSSFHKGAAVLAVNAAVSKFGDRKLKEGSGLLLSALARAVGPDLVMGKVCSAASLLKAPPAQQACLEWCAQSCVAEFGALKLPLKPVSGLGAAFAGHRDAKLRSAALDLLCALYKAVGPRMRSLCLPPTLPSAAAKAVEDALDKAGFDPTLAAAAAVEAEAAAAAAAATKTEASGIERGGGDGAVLQQQHRVVDLATLLDVEEVVERLGNVGDKDAWKQRKAGLDEVSSVVAKQAQQLVLFEANKAFVDLLRAVKKRVNDTQTNLKPVALSLLAALVRSVEPKEVAKCVRAVAAELLAGVQDTKKATRDKVVAVLELCVTLPPKSNPAAASAPSAKGAEGVAVAPGALDAFFPFLCAALHKPVGRLELLAWLAKHCASGSFSPSSTSSAAAASGGGGNGKALDTAQVVPPLLSALADKDKSTRSQASQCLNALCLAGLLGSGQALERAFHDLPPTTKRTLQPSVDAAMEKVAEHKAAAAAGASTGATKAPVASVAVVEEQAAEVREEKVQAAAPLKSGGASVGSKEEGPGVRERHAVVATSTGGGGGKEVGGLKRNGKRLKREAEFKGNGNKGWCAPPEEPKKAEAEALRHQWHEHLTSEAEAALFPATLRGTMEDAVPGLELLEKVLASDTQDGVAVLVEHLDFVCKWATLRMCERESVPVLQRLLDFLGSLLAKLRVLNQSDGGKTNESSAHGGGGGGGKGAAARVRFWLSDPLQAILLPYLCEKSGNGKQRFRDQFRTVLGQCGVLCSPATAPQGLPQARFAQYLLGCCAQTKRATTKAVCLGEFARVVRETKSLHPFSSKSGHGGVGGLKGHHCLLLEAAKHVESNDNEVRAAALQGLVEAHAIARYDAKAVLACLQGGGGNKGGGGGGGEGVGLHSSVLTSKVLVIISERLKGDRKEAQKRDSPRLKPVSAAEQAAASAAAVAAATAVDVSNTAVSSSSQSLSSTDPMSERLSMLQAANGSGENSSNANNSQMPSLKLPDHINKSGGGGVTVGETRETEFALTLSLGTPMNFGGRGACGMPPPSTARGKGRVLQFDKEEEDAFTFQAPPPTPGPMTTTKTMTFEYSVSGVAAAPAVAPMSLPSSDCREDPAAASVPSELKQPSSSSLFLSSIQRRRSSGGKGRRRSSGDKFGIFNDDDEDLPGCGGGAEESMQLLDFDQDADSDSVTVGKFAKLKSAVVAFLALPEHTEKAQDSKQRAYADGKDALREILRVFSNPQALAEHELMLCKHGEELFQLVGLCLRKAFCIGGAAKRFLDLSTFTFSVTMLMSLAKCATVHVKLGAGSVQAVLKECVVRLLQGRADGETGLSPTTACEPLLPDQYLMALSNTAKALATHAPLTASLTAVVNLLAETGSNNNRRRTHSSPGGGGAASAAREVTDEAMVTKRSIVLAALLHDVVSKEKLNALVQNDSVGGDGSSSRDGIYSGVDLVALFKSLDALVNSLSEASILALSSTHSSSGGSKKVKVCRDLLIDLITFRGSGGGDGSREKGVSGLGGQQLPLALALAMDAAGVGPHARLRQVLSDLFLGVAQKTSAQTSALSQGLGNSAAPTSSATSGAFGDAGDDDSHDDREEQEYDRELESLVLQFSAASAAATKENESSSSSLAGVSFSRKKTERQQEAQTALCNFASEQTGTKRRVGAWLRIRHVPPCLIATIETALLNLTTTAPPPLPPPLLLRNSQPSCSAEYGEVESDAVASTRVGEKFSLQARLAAIKKQSAAATSKVSSSEPVVVPATATVATVNASAFGAGVESSDAMLARIRQRLSGNSSTNTTSSSVSKSNTSSSSSLVRFPLGEATNRAPTTAGGSSLNNIHDRLAMLKARAQLQKGDRDPVAVAAAAASLSPRKTLSDTPHQAAAVQVDNSQTTTVVASHSVDAPISMLERLAALKAKASK